MALPSPSVATATTRYFVAGVRRITWVPTIASKGAPTSAELSAGTDVTSEVVDGSVNGFDVSADDQEVPDVGSTFTGKIPGRTSSSDSSFEYYLSSNATDLRTLLIPGTNGFVVIYPEGIVSSGKCDIFPVRIRSNSKKQDTSDAGKSTAMFSITSKPVIDLAIPTA